MNNLNVKSKEMKHFELALQQENITSLNLSTARGRYVDSQTNLCFLMFVSGAVYGAKRVRGTYKPPLLLINDGKDND
jgi:hypothetical protein